MRTVGIFLLVFGLSALCLPTAFAGRFVDNGNGTITDACTGLVWQNGRSPEIHLMSEVVQYCDNLTLGGYADWRVPRIDELVGVYKWPDVEGIFVGDWSINEWDADAPWVMMGRGAMHGCPWDWDLAWPKPYYVTCVRNESIRPFDPSSALVVQSDAIARDIYDDYQWQRNTDGVARTWPEARDYCQNLVLDGFDDWRLPTARELDTIADRNRINPALTPGIFTVDPPIGSRTPYWSATPGRYIQNAATGEMVLNSKDPAYARCVRWGPGPIPGFTATPVRGYQPLSVNFFHDTAGSPASSYWWDFGDSHTINGATQFGSTVLNIRYSRPPHTTGCMSHRPSAVRGGENWLTMRHRSRLTSRRIGSTLWRKRAGMCTY